jgi:medium-chain acyl-[acyl-carrier-protein] hydrolase
VPYAGAGAGVFNAWADRLPDDVELVAARLPGRETRFRERQFSEWEPFADEFARAIDSQVRSPYIALGHSMGAMLVYEAVTRASGRLPERVILSGCRAPGTPPASPPIHDLPSRQFTMELERLAATPPEILADERIMAVLEPMLRADIRLAETWPHQKPLALPVALTTFHGTDDPIAPPHAVAEWQALAPHGYASYAIPGGHFFIHDNQTEFFRRLRDELL